MPSGLRLGALASCGAAAFIGLAALMLCGRTPFSAAQAAEEPPHPAALDHAIVAAAQRHGVPESLVRRIIMRESKYNPRARNHKFWGLMQISYPTAKSMGFRGTPQELLNPVVNLRYAVPYLANAFVIAGKRQETAVRLYAAGYYNTAKSRGLLSALRTADSEPLTGVAEEQPILAANAVVQPPQSVGIFGALFGPGSQLQPQAQADPQPTTATADASQAAAQPASGTAAAPAGTFNGPTAAMVADKNGSAKPPKKWLRDGGMSVVARGEQALDQIASRGKVADASPSKSSRRRARKLTAYAALDLPASNAQAYAPPAAQDTNFFAAASQTAIAQATSSAQTPATAPATTDSVAPAPPQAPLAQGQSPAQIQAATTDQSVEDEKPAKRRRARHAKRKSREGQTKEARAEKNATAENVATPSTTTR